MIAKRLVPALLLCRCLAVGATIPVVRPYLEIDGKEVAPGAVQLRQTPQQITATLRAPADGTYSFGVSISAPEIASLEPARTRYGCAALKQPLVLHYPYDWTLPEMNGNILTARPRLVMPGFEAGGQLYVADTHELFALRLDACKQGIVRAVALAHHFFNDGADQATPRLHLRAGESREFTIKIYKDIAAANRDRLGEHEQSMRGNMTEVSFLEYAERSATEHDTFFSTQGITACCRGLTPEEWERTAEKFQNTLRYVIIREQKSSDWIPPIFHKRGMLVYHYQYLNALRRWTPEVTPEVERDFALRDSKGQIYASPHPPDGNWLQVDIRRPEVRAMLVENARAAVRHGFDGIFLDGYPFWSDTTGRAGGNVPNATESLASARWQLLRETKAAMRAENPKATLGLLTNHYYDTLGVGDWGMEEFMYGSWYVADPLGGNDTVGHYRSATGSIIRPEKSRAYEEQDAVYQPYPIAYGAKGLSSIAVQSMLHMIEHPSGLYYGDCGTFPIADLNQWSDMMVSFFQQNDLYITSIDPPTCAVRLERGSIMQSEKQCTLKFSRPACLTELPGGKPVGGIEKMTIAPGLRYKVSRSCGN